MNWMQRFKQRIDEEVLGNKEQRTNPMPQNETRSTPKAASTDHREVSKKKWRFTDSPEVQKRLADGWRIIGERCVTNGESYYSEPEGWVWEDNEKKPVSVTVEERKK